VTDTKDSLRKRMAARAKLNDPKRPPSLTIQFVDPLIDANGVCGGVLCDARYATVGGVRVDRRDDETLEQFEQRVWGLAPTGPIPVLTIFFPDEPPFNAESSANADGATEETAGEASREQ
jgi:hypothetical protein